MRIFTLSYNYHSIYGGLYKNGPHKLIYVWIFGPQLVELLVKDGKCTLVGRGMSFEGSVGSQKICAILIPAACELSAVPGIMPLFCHHGL